MMKMHSNDHVSAPSFEPLEPRLLLAADFQGFVPDGAVLSFNNTGTITYDAANESLVVDAEPLSLRKDGAALPNIVFTPRDFDINIQVDNNGDLIGGVVGDDLVIVGDADLDGDFVPDGFATLLTGEVTHYAGFDGATPGVDNHEFIFEVTGGVWADQFPAGFVGVTMASEQSNFVADYAVDFNGGAKGILGEIPAAGLGDRVWHDVDANGVQDSGEPGIGDSTVTLLSDLDGDGEIDDIVATTTTADGTGSDPVGYYEFTDLTPGRDYVVDFDLPTGFDQFTGRDSASDDAADSDADPTDGRSQVVVLESGQFNPTIDAGVFNLAGLGDFVWRDRDVDGIQDDGEPGIEGVVVELLDADGNVIDSATTNGDGLYQFTGLIPDTYSTRIAGSNFDSGGALEGLFPTLRNEGGDDTVDSDGLRNSPYESDSTTLASGDFDPTLDFGFFGTGIDLVKTGPDTAAPGEVIEYVFTLTNTGDADLQNVVINDPLISATPILVGYLASGDSTIVTQAFIIPTTGAQTTFDFEVDGVGAGLAAGTIIDDEYAAQGVTVTSNDPTRHPVMIFDSANPTGGDWDLGTPNVTFGGPGQGSGGEAGMPGANDVALDNILIISEDGDQSDPDDNARGGSIIFTFDTPRFVDTVSVLDVDSNEPNGTIQAFDASGSLISETEIANLSNNSFQQVAIGTAGVTTLKVNFPSSGAVTELVLDGELTKVTNVATASGDPVAPGEDLPDPEDDDMHMVTIVNADPGIDVEKLTNGVDADWAGEAVEIAAGDTVTWTYEVTNTGNVAFDRDEVSLIDDNGTPDDAGDDFVPTLVESSDAGDDDVLSPGETWVYTASAPALDLGDGTGDMLDFRLTGSSSLDGPNGNVRTFSDGGVTVNASAFSKTSNGDFRTAFLGAFGSGLGVTDRSEGDGGNGLHRTDNVGEQNFILFEFSEDVMVDKVYLDSVVNDSDISIWIGNVDGPVTFDQALLDSLEVYEVNNTTSGNERWADINGDGVSGNVLVIAASIEDHTPEDRFKVRNVWAKTVEPGVYRNMAVVTVPGAGDEDASHYTNAEAIGGEGLTPGYWRQSHHFCAWTDYSPQDSFEQVFGVDATGDPTLGEAVRARGGGESALQRHAVAALLNASNAGIDYAFTEAQIIAMVQQAYATGQFEATKNIFVVENERGGEADKDDCDTGCNGKKDRGDHNKSSKDRDRDQTERRERGDRSDHNDKKSKRKSHHGSKSKAYYGGGQATTGYSMWTGGYAKSHSYYGNHFGGYSRYSWR